MDQTKIVQPKMLRVLIILSFIGSSWNMFSGLSNALSEPSIERYDNFMESMRQIDDGSPEMKIMMDQISEYVANINLNIVNYGAIEFMLYAISLIGVYLMHKNRRVGFRVYAIAQLLLLGSPIYFGSYSVFTLSLTIFYAFFTMVFFALYSSQLKYMDS